MRILPVYNLSNNYLRFTFKSNDTSSDLVDKMQEKRHDLDDSLAKNESSQDSVEDKISSVKSDIQTQTSQMEIGRASVGKECVRRCRSRWSPYH